MVLALSQLHQKSSETANNSRLMHSLPGPAGNRLSNVMPRCCLAAPVSQLKYKVRSLGSYGVPSTAEQVATTCSGETAFPPAPPKLPFFFITKVPENN